MIEAPLLLFEDYWSRGLESPLRFATRPGTSDHKSIDEVVTRRCYAGHRFTPQPGERWLDLGANVGAYSIWAAAHGAHVTAFEPEPSCLEQFAINLALNPELPGTVEVIPAAVGLRPGRASLSVNAARGNLWRSSLTHRWQGGYDVDVTVAGLTPGYWTPEANIKMDIEGSELPILLELARTRVNRLVFEWSFDLVMQKRSDDLDLFRALMTELTETYENVRGIPVSAQTRHADHWTRLGSYNAATIYCW